MKRKEFLDWLIKTHTTEIELSERKNDDYADVDDVLANFRRMHAACKLWDVSPAKRPEDVFFFFLLLKLDRFINICHKEGAPNNESLDDTGQDSVIYWKLLRAFLQERGK